MNASRRPSRDAAHHSGSGWLARPSPWGTFTSYSLPASWRTPERVTKYAHFLNRSFYGTPPRAYDVLVLVLNDGTEKEGYTLLHEAMQAWDRELTRRQL